jgi:hypothetical protein
MNTTNQSLFDVIDGLDNTARVPALRAIVHSTMAKCIGSIRQHIRDQARTVRNDESPLTDLDQRNETDENSRSDDDIKQAMGFETQSPLKQASLLHAVYDVAQHELLTISTSKWDIPLTLEQMLQFMINNTPKLDRVLAQALADAAKTDIKTIERMHELQSQREREQLIEAIPEIIQTFNGFGANGYSDAIDEIPKIDQHQLAIKVVESLNKTRDQILARVLRTRRISELGSIPILEDAAKQISTWVEQFERRYGDEFREAIESGRNIRTLEDITI